MQRVIHKLSVPLEGDTLTATLPRGAEVIAIGDQYNTGGQLDLWFIRDPEVTETETQCFRVLGTGHPFDSEEIGEHVTTVLTAGGALIWHVFRVSQKVPA